MYYLGVDFGSQQDYTAMALVRRYPKIVHTGGIMEKSVVEYHLLFLERMQLGVNYLDVVSRIREVIHDVKISQQVVVVADATGVGLPIIQLMRQNDIYPLIPVTIHAGAAVSEKHGGYGVPKRDLVYTAVMILQQRRLKVAPDIALRDELIKEMSAFVPKATASRNDTYEALTQKDHDDIVMALSYALWFPEKTLGAAVSLEPEPPQDIDILAQDRQAAIL